MVPAQRAAALGLAHHPTHTLPSSSSRGSTPGDVHFVPLASGSGGSGYPGHTRSHSHTPSSSSHGCVSGGVVGYGHYVASGASTSEHHPHAVHGPHNHHKSLNVSQSSVSSVPFAGVGGSGHGHGHGPLTHSAAHGMSSLHQLQRRGRGRVDSSRGLHPSALGVSGQQSRSSAYGSSEYDRSQHASPAFSHSTSYPPPGWSGDGPGMARSVPHGALRSQSPPPLISSASEGRSGGGAPRPPTPPRSYELPYGRYQVVPGHGGVMDAYPAGVSAPSRRHSGSSLMTGSSRISALSSMIPSRQERVGGGGGGRGGLGGVSALSPSSSYSRFYMSATTEDIGNERESCEHNFPGPCSHLP